MAEFEPSRSGPGGFGGTTTPDYRLPTVVKFKRITLASFLCGIAACILVALIGVALVFLGFQLADLFGSDAGILFDDEGILQGIGIAAVISAMNWYVGYFTIPAAWLVLALSLGRFPRRGIVRPGPYYRWGAIWGAILVGTTAAIVASAMSSGAIAAGAGGLLAGALIGGGAGVICGGIFRGIVRPASQVTQIQVDVF